MMFAEKIPLDHQYVLNLSNKIIGQSSIAFPIVDTLLASANTPSEDHNQVTFIYKSDLAEEHRQDDIYLIGSFDHLYRKQKLQQVFFNETPTRFWAITLKLPTKKYYQYKFKIQNTLILDPLNNLIKTSDKNVEWSTFFTQYYKENLIFEHWEMVILQRLIAYILPLKTNEFKKFVNENQGGFSNKTKSLLSQLSYDIGCANFIDKLIAKDEKHHIVNYKICLKEIKRVLLSLNQFQEPGDMDEYFYQRIYQIMGENDFNFWNSNVYENPSYFLSILRRHIITAAFSHPKHGGNTDALGWQFLSALLKGGDHDSTGYDWQQAIEKPLGKNNEYVG